MKKSKILNIIKITIISFLALICLSLCNYVEAAVAIPKYDGEQAARTVYPSGKNFVMVDGKYYKIYFDDNQKAYGVEYNIPSIDGAVSDVTTGNTFYNMFANKEQLNEAIGMGINQKELKESYYSVELQSITEVSNVEGQASGHDNLSEEAKEAFKNAKPDVDSSIPPNTQSKTTNNPDENKNKSEQKPTTLDELLNAGKNFIDAGKPNADKNINQEDLKDISNTIYNILLGIGIIIAVAVGLILGIKFMLGSVEQKADIKNMLVPYVIGCVIIFGAFTIWKIVVDILQSM